MTVIRVSKAVLDRVAAVTPQLYGILRQRILLNDLEPGTRLSESEVATEYLTSRQPVREAFIKLAEEGLVEIRPQRGTFVRKIANSAVLGAQFVRTAIETDIVRLLADIEVGGLESELRRQLAEQAEAAKTDPARFQELDELFHRTLAEAAGKTYAWNVVDGVSSHMNRARVLSVRQFPSEKLVDQHAAIVDAIAKHDADAAEAVMRRHLEKILIDLPTIVRNNPGFFDDPEP